MEWPFVLSRTANGSLVLRYVQNNGSGFVVQIYTVKDQEDEETLKEILIADAQAFIRENGLL